MVSAYLILSLARLVLDTVIVDLLRVVVGGMVVLRDWAPLPGTAYHPDWWWPVRLVTSAMGEQQRLVSGPHLLLDVFQLTNYLSTLLLPEFPHLDNDALNIIIDDMTYIPISQGKIFPRHIHFKCKGVFFRLLL